MVLLATVLTNPISAQEKVIRSALQEALFIVLVAGREGLVQRVAGKVGYNKMDRRETPVGQALAEAMGTNQIDRATRDGGDRHGSRPGIVGKDRGEVDPRKRATPCARTRICSVSAHREHQIEHCHRASRRAAL